MMIKRLNCILFLCFCILVSTCAVSVGEDRARVEALSFPSIEFCYGTDRFVWSLGQTGEGVASDENANGMSHNAIFEMQKKYLETKKIGFANCVKNLRALNYTDKQILFEILPNFNLVYGQMAKKIEQEFKETEIKFNPLANNNQNMFAFIDGQKGVKIDDARLLSDVLSGKSKIEIKVLESEPKFLAKDLEKNVALRSCQSTSFAGSEEGRKFNLKKAMATFNGLVVMPNEVVSFSSVLDRRDDGEPYREAIVIVNGEFTKGVGGGICQASTTIYNAVLMAGLEILEVHRHTLPVGYVEKGFDAMVNDGGIDMRFKNNTDMPIYIKTYAKDSSVFAEVYGTSLGDMWFKKVSEKVRDIEPDEPKIVADVDGKYISRIKYKGEFFTEKYAKKGYEVKGYLYTYVGDKVQSIKLVRHEKYASTRAIIYEGVEEPPIVKDVEGEKVEN